MNPSRVYRLICLTLVSLFSFTAIASAEIREFNVTSSDGIPHQGVAACAGEGCVSQYIAQGFNYAGSVSYSDEGGSVRVEASPGQTVELVYEQAFKAGRQGFGDTWFRSNGSAPATFVFPRLLPAGSHPSLSKNGASFVRLVNQARSENGLVPVVSINSLDSVSDVQSTWSAANNSRDNPGHVGQFNWSPRQRAVDVGYSSPNETFEITAYSLNAQTTFTAFMNSPVHRSIILKPEVRFVGVGDTGYFWNATFASSCSARCEASVVDPATPDGPAAGSSVNPGTGTPLDPPTGGSPSGVGKPSNSPQACTPKLSKLKGKRLSKGRVKLTFSTSCSKGTKLAVKLGSKYKYLSFSRGTVTFKSKSKKLKVGLYAKKRVVSVAMVSVKK